MDEVEALLFDVFGTLVDWRGSLIADLTAFGAERGLGIDWAAFTDAWRDAYAPSMNRVRSGELPWTTLDALHRSSFDALAAEFGISGALDEAGRGWCVDRWHRLRAWDDVGPGLTRLHRRAVTGTLSNGNIRLLVDLARTNALHFDVLFSAETFRRYKRDPDVYRGAVAMLALPPERVALVAAHADDLLAARAEGLRTVYVTRAERGPDVEPERAPAGVDLAVRGLDELADRLGV